jgi:hypothetical protein
VVAWEIKNMGGVIPRMDNRLIPDNMAVEAVNCDLTGGQLVGLPHSEFLIDLSSKLPVVERAYRFPTHEGNIIWLPLPSRYSSVVRSPVANDVYDRVYWTNPGDISPHWTTPNDIVAGNPPFDLGMAQPETAPTVINVTGGNALLMIDRSYVYTYLNSYNEESAPSPASDIYTGPSDGVWHIADFPTDAPANPAGRNYAPIIGIRIYRTITSAASGAQFYFITSATLPWVGTLVDGVSDSLVVMNEVLETTGYRNPPDYLDGLVSLPGEFLAGFTQNTIHFSEPDRPYSWPDVYDQTANYKIINLAVGQQFLIILTEGYTSVASGNSPSNILLTQSQVAEPCISRGSVVVDMSGVFYASQNGLIQTTGFGMQNLTAPIVEKNEWLLRYFAKSLVAARHRSQFIAVNTTDWGFLIDYAETRLAFQDLTDMKDVVCIWNDEYTGDTMMCANGKIYEWDCPTTSPQTYRWKSKRFFTPMPISLGAAQVELDEEIYTTVVEADNPLNNGDPSIQLPAGVNAVFNYYAGPKLDLIMSRNLTRQMEIFRLPNGFKCFDHQVEVISRVPISSIQLSTTLAELKQA